ncbi:MAG: hypothetical protein WC728_10805 [Elusimicrobiota bacterium]
MKKFGFCLLACLSVGSAGAAEFQAATPLPQGFVGHALLHASGYLYNVGGLAAKEGVFGADRTYYAKITAPGVLAAWQEGPRLPEPLFYHAYAATADTLYVMGGHHYNSGLKPSVAVYYSRIGADGVPGAWQIASSLPAPVFLHSAAAWKGRLYVTGGWVPGMLSNQVYSAAMQADGSLGAWTALAALPEAVYTHTTVVDGTLYVLGGAVNGGSEMSDAVFYSRIREDGTLEPWGVTTSLPAPVSNHAAAVHAERLYVLGGWGGSGPVDAVNSAHILSDKSLGVWESEPALPVPLYMHSTTVGGDTLYVSGGSNGVYSQSGVYSLELSQPKLVATADLRPNTLNLLSLGNFVTCYLEFPTASRAKASDIEPSSILVARINGSAPSVDLKALSKPTSLGDEDQDGVQDLMVKFSRHDFALSLGAGDNRVELEGRLKDGTPFTAEASIWAKAPWRRVARRIRLFENAQARLAHLAGIHVSSTAALGQVTSHGGRVGCGARSSVELPDGATPGTFVTVSPAEGSEEREKALGKGLLRAAGPAVEFGPEGSVFLKPVTLRLPFDASVSDVRTLMVHYWNPNSKAWEALPSRVDLAEQVVVAETTHFSLYQVLAGGAPAADSSGDFAFDQVYAFPNPARGGQTPTIHAEAGAAESLDIRIYDISGGLVHSASLAGPAPLVDDGSGRGGVSSFEYRWDVSGVGSGVYIYVLTAHKGGSGDIRKSGKLAVIK